MIEEIMANGLILCGRKGGNNSSGSEKSPELEIVS
jgi:hypothetical protein